VSQVAIGVDIAKDKFDVARLCEGKYRHKKFDNNPQGFAAFLAWLAGFGDDRPWVGREATGAYSAPLAEFLVAPGCRVSVVNPAKIHAFAKSELSRAKTDKADAKRIARYCLVMRPAPWTPPPMAIRELQARLRRAEHRLQMQQMERNRLDTAGPLVAGSLKTVLDTLDKELDAVRKRIKSHLNGDPDLKQRKDLLESIPGVGSATSAWLLTLLSPHYEFANAKQAVAPVGLAPKLRESGKWKGSTRLSKTGDPGLRKA
jgi:transposase